MTLDNFRTINLTIDKANGHFFSDQFAKEGDYDGRRLVVQITDNGVVEDLSHVDVHLGWKHDDKKNSGLNSFEAVDAGKGIFEVYYPREMLHPGQVTAVIQIVDDGKITETKNFRIKVGDSVVNAQAAVEENSFTILQEALIKVNQYDNRINSLERDKADKAELEQTKQEVTAQLDQTQHEATRKRQLEDLDEEVLSAIEGGEGTSFNLLSIPQDNSVSYSKTDDYIRGKIVSTEKIIGSETESFVGKKSLNLSDYISLTSAGSNRMYVSKEPAVQTGLLTIYFVSGGEASSNFLILERTDEPIDSPNAFETVGVIPFTTNSDDLRKVITIETDFVIEKGQYLGVEDATRIFLDNSGLNEGYYRRVLGDSYFSTPVGPIFYGQVGGRASVIENMQNQLRNITTEGTVTVKDFGAKGDGVTDDTEALQNAMEILAGGEVVIPNGDYLVTGTIEIPSDTIVRGYGSSSRIILGDGFELTNYNIRLGGSSILANEPNAKNVIVRDLTIEGNKNEPLEGTRLIGLGFIDLTNGVAENVHINNINYFPELMTADTSPTGYNFTVARSENIEVRGGTFTNGGYECLGVYDGCRNVIIDGVYTGTAWRTSLQIHRDCWNVKVINSTINQQSPWAAAGLTTHGIQGQELKDIVIHNNTIYATSREIPQASYSGTVQLMDGGVAEGYRITNNHIRGKRTGIYMTRSRNNVVSGNNIDVETAYGIYTPAICEDTIITNNIVRVPNNNNPMHSESTLVINNIGLEDHIPTTV